MPNSDDQLTERPEKKVLYVLQPYDPTAADSSLDLAAWIRVIWVRRWWIIVLTAIVTAVAAAYSLMAPSWYRAEAVLMPRENSAGAGLASGLARFGGLAELASLGLGTDNRQEPLGVLRSHGFSKRLVEQNRLATELERAQASRLFQMGGEETVDQRDLIEIFRRSILTVSEDRKTGLVTVAIEWMDPVEAANWANIVSRQINAEMRARAMDESNRNIIFLQDQLERTETVSLQQAIARLVESEMQKAMIAQGTDQYAFRIIDEARPPIRRSWPKRSLIVFLAFFVTFVTSTLGVLVAEYMHGMIASMARK